MPQLRICGNERNGGISLTPKARIKTEPIGDNLHPLKNVHSWKASDTYLEATNTGYYLKNSTFQEIINSLEASLDNKQLSKLSEILSLIIKEYEEEI
mgnify:CR=1 FL=1